MERWPRFALTESHAPVNCTSILLGTQNSPCNTSGASHPAPTGEYKVAGRVFVCVNQKKRECRECGVNPGARWATRVPASHHCVPAIWRQAVRCIICGRQALIETTSSSGAVHTARVRCECGFTGPARFSMESIEDAWLAVFAEYEQIQAAGGPVAATPACGETHPFEPRPPLA